MRIFAGLGNPGTKYAASRHNIGFMVLDRVAAAHGFAPWTAKFQGKISRGTLATEPVLLLKPQTFMNASGQSVGAAMRFYRLAPADVIVFHDELDLAPGQVRVKCGGGSAGHNGLRSIDHHIGAGYRRVRLGIGHPGHKTLVTGHVLGDFAAADQSWLEDVLQGVTDGAGHLAHDHTDRFLTKVVQRRAPPGPPHGPKTNPT